MDLETARLAAKVTEFWRNVQVGRPDECWPWAGYAEKGYGRWFFDGRMMGAHELALTFATGEIRMAGLETCHGCHVPLCCNPQHLRFDTRQANVDDMMQVGRQAAPRRKLTDEQVRLIRHRRAAGAAQELLAEQFGVSDALISGIVNGHKRVAAGGPIATGREYRRMVKE